MFDTFTASRSALTPQEALDIAKFCLHNAQKSESTNLTLLLCANVEAVFSRMKRAEKKALIPPTCAEDQIMCQEIAAVYAEHGQLLNRLGERERAQVSFRKADKWNVSSLMSGHFSQENKRETDRSDIANVSPEIFSQNVARPIAKHYLPKSDERIANTPQLVYCLNLLSKIPLSSPTAEELEEPLDDAERTWIQSKAEDRDEQDRLRSLSTKLIVEFIDDDLKDSSAIAEVVCLAPILDQVHYRKLLSHFIDNIENSALLHFDMLEGLAQLIHSASTGYLHADDLVRILHVLKIRLQDTHKQSTEHLYQLAAAVSNVLDAMADCNVKGLDRERLHAPLAAYLDRLKNSSDPYLVYHAAYASQALLYVPDNETPLQSVTRRTRVLLTGIFGMASAVRSLDVNGFIDGLEQLQGGLTDVYRVVKIGCEGVTSLVEGGQGLLESLMEGLSFSQKRAWYPALRGIDILLADGRVADFKKLVCEAPDRRDPAFQWGLCQRLSEIASNSVWDASARKSAIEFLGDLYRNDMDWGQHASVKQRIIIVLIQLADMPDRTVLDHAHTLLHDLERNGAAAKQALYHSIRTGPKTSYVLKSGLSPGASMLLDRVQDIPDIEDDLRKLRNQRLEERSRNVYIPPQAKSSLQASDASLFPLMGKVNDFLNSDRRVLLLLGDSGAGKSTFSRALECDLWSVYKKDGRIPLHINLPAIDRPEKDLIAKHLRRNDFTEAQIREIKYHRELVVICDGYDESQLSNNLYTSNQLNKQSQWRVKMVISCRSEYLPQDYRDRFQPTVQNRGATSSLFQEAVIVPFSEAQIEDYIKQYVSLNRPQWRLKDYLQALDGLPNLMDLVKNPFLLTLSLEVLPRVVDLSQIHDLSGTKVTRVALFDQFVEQWLERGKKRARSRDLSPQAKTAFDSLVDEGFTQSGIHFLKRLAAAIYREQEGHPVVEYSRLRDDQTWKSAFFSREDEIRILREASPISRSGNQFRFIHRSLMEYCFSLAVFDPQECKIEPTLFPSRRGSVSSIFSFEGQSAPRQISVNIPSTVVDHPLSWRSFVGEPSILQLLAERVQQEPAFKQQLLDMVERSKTNKDDRIAAANAITILVRAGVRFNGADLTGVQIPGADLSGGEFDSAQLQGADLRKVNLRSIWLRQADLSDAQMAGVQFGEWPYLAEDAKILSFAYAADGNACVTGLKGGLISMYDTTTWTKICSLGGHTDDILNVVFSPSGDQVASGSCDRTVRLWDAQTGAPGMILNCHEREVTGVAFSPNGQQIASSSRDRSVRLWDAQTGEPGLVLIGHGGSVTSVIYSPSGQQIATGSEDMTLRLWNAETGAPGLILVGHSASITSVAYSPSGQQIASGSEDSTVRLWDTESGAPGPVLTGHNHIVTSVVYSPSGQQIASGSHDKTVRLWDTQTGASGPVLSGHTHVVSNVVYTPSGQIASASRDRTVRTWDIPSGAPIATSTGHTDGVTGVVYISSGRQIASGSRDSTVRIWDADTGTPGPVLGSHTGFVSMVVSSPGGDQFASSSRDSTARLWDAKTGAPGPVVIGYTDKHSSTVAYAPNGRQFATCGNDGLVRLWDTQTGAPGPVLRGHTGAISAVVYSPNGLQIVSGSWDKTVRFWDALTGARGPILSGHISAVTSLAYSPKHQQIASAGNEDTVRLWDTQTGAASLMLHGHGSGVTCVSYSPCGNQIASGSYDKTARLWNALTGVPGPILEGHTNAVICLHYAPSHRKIASGSWDMTVRLWDTNSGECLAVVMDFHARITSITWNEHPGGLYFATGCYDTSVRTWKLIEEGGQYKVRLQWSSTHGGLVVSNAIIQNTQGLSRSNMKLLKQRGSLGEPSPPMNLRKAYEKLVSMRSVVSRLKVVSGSGQLNTSAAPDTPDHQLKIREA